MSVKEMLPIEFDCRLKKSALDSSYHQASGEQGGGNPFNIS